MDADAFYSKRTEEMERADDLLRPHVEDALTAYMDGEAGWERELVLEASDVWMDIFTEEAPEDGKRGLALRFTLLYDHGIVSALRKPTRSNWRYFLVGLRGRLSAFGHYLLYLASR